MTLFPSLDASHKNRPLDIPSEDIRTAFSGTTPGSFIMASSKSHVSYIASSKYFSDLNASILCPHIISGSLLR